MGEQKKKKQRVVVAGYYGLGNLGDEVLLHVVLRWLKQTFPEVEPCVLSGDMEQTRRHFGVRAVNRLRFSSLLRAFWGAKALIFGGGGLLQDATSRRSLIYYLSLIRLASWMGVPVIMLGQGLGPLTQRGEGRVVEQLQHVDYINVRDSQSFQLLSQWGFKKVYQGVDLALNLRLPQLTPEKQQTRPLLGLGLVTPPESQINRVSDWLAQAITDVQQQYGLQPIFLAVSKQDLRFGVALNKRVPSMTVLPLSQDTPEKHLAMFDGLSVLWGSRLHSIILSSIAGVPFVALGYDPKVEGYVNQLNQKMVHPMTHWPLNDFDADALVETTGTLLKGFHNFGNQLKQATSQFRTEAEASLKDAESYLQAHLGLHDTDQDNKVNSANARGEK